MLIFILDECKQDLDPVLKIKIFRIRIRPQMDGIRNPEFTESCKFISWTTFPPVPTVPFRENASKFLANEIWFDLNTTDNILILFSHWACCGGGSLQSQPLRSQLPTAGQPGLRWRPVSVPLPARNDWLTAQLSARVLPQLGLCPRQGLHLSQVSGSLSRPVRCERCVPCQESCAHLCVQSGLWGGSLLTVSSGHK